MTPDGAARRLERFSYVESWLSIQEIRFAPLEYFIDIRHSKKPSRSPTCCWHRESPREALTYLKVPCSTGRRKSTGKHHVFNWMRFEDKLSFESCPACKIDNARISRLSVTSIAIITIRGI